MTFRVFVYGSLLRGLHNHHLLAKSKLVAAARTAQPAYVLIDSGHGFPYAVADARARQEDCRVALLGEIYEVDTAVLSRLDELEEHPTWYQRREVEVSAADEPAARAWIYLLESDDELAKIAKDPKAYRPVTTQGDWRAHLQADPSYAAAAAALDT
tara:strand:- start:3456 stop:3923 length:468 start_codon:yes stop_codon:yes gene_type:complete